MAEIFGIRVNGVAAKQLRLRLAAFNLLILGLGRSKLLAAVPDPEVFVLAVMFCLDILAGRPG